MSCAGGPDLIQDGLVLHLDAADRKSYPGSGTIWTDRSGFGNNGTLTNGPTFSATNGGSIIFDGSNDYIDYGTPSSVDFNNKTNITVSCWFNANAASSVDTNLISKIYQWYTNFNNDRKVRVGFYTGVGTYNVFYTNTIFNLNTWYMVTWTYDGSSIKVYTNGLLDKSVNETNSIKYGESKNCNLLVGAEANFCGGGVSRYFNGKIAQASVYNRTFSASEILQNYNSQKSRFNLR